MQKNLSENPHQKKSQWKKIVQKKNLTEKIDGKQFPGKVCWEKNKQKT
jgi:hypothetical protein